MLQFVVLKVTCYGKVAEPSQVVFRTATLEVIYPPEMLVKVSTRIGPVLRVSETIFGVFVLRSLVNPAIQMHSQIVK